MNPKRINWLNKTIRQRLVFILILVITSLISILTVNILKLDLTTLVIYILALLLGLIILVFLLYIQDFIRNLDELRLDECIAHDITVLNFEKNLIFDENSHADGTFIEEIRIIRNNMQHSYNLYQFNNSTDVDPPIFSKFEFYKDGKRMNYTSDDVQFHSCGQTDHEDSLNKKIDLKFPVHAPMNETREIKVKYPIKAFESAIRGETDWAQVTINAITERVRISVSLNGSLKTTHILAAPLPPNSSGEEQDIEIRDFSNERMWSSELIYKQQNIKPKWSKEKMEWVIYRPKIGYRYRVYFTIKSKES